MINPCETSPEDTRFVSSSTAKSMVALVMLSAAATQAISAIQNEILRSADAFHAESYANTGNNAYANLYENLAGRDEAERNKNLAYAVGDLGVGGFCLLVLGFNAKRREDISPVDLPSSPAPAGPQTPPVHES